MTLTQRVRQHEAELLAQVGPVDVRRYHALLLVQWALMVAGAGLASSGWWVPALVCTFAFASIRFGLFHELTHKSLDNVDHPLNVFQGHRYFQPWRTPLTGRNFVSHATWAFGHNQLHHFALGEIGRDHDVMQHLAQRILEKRWPTVMKQLFYLLVAPPFWQYTWQVRVEERRLNPDQEQGSDISPRFFHPFWAPARAVWKKSLLPWVALELVALPVAFQLVLGWDAFAISLAFAGAQWLLGYHTLFLFLGNHNAPDMPLYSTRFADLDEHYRRQFLTTKNWNAHSLPHIALLCSVPLQVEHHLFPRVPMSRHREMTEAARALAEEFGLPYREIVYPRDITDQLRILAGDLMPVHTDVCNALGGEPVGSGR